MLKCKCKCCYETADRWDGIVHHETSRMMHRPLDCLKEVFILIQVLLTRTTTLTTLAITIRIVVTAVTMSTDAMN